MVVVGRETRTGGVGAAPHPHNEKHELPACMSRAFLRLSLPFLEHWMNDTITKTETNTDERFEIRSA